MHLELKDLFELQENANEKVYIKLLEALKNNARTEMDYLKFKKSYMSLSKLGMDETTSAKSAFVTAETMGFTKEKLIDSLSFYQTVLKKEKEAFALALKNQITNNVEAKQVEVEKLQNRKIEIITKIEKLKEELSGIDTHVKDIENSIQQTSQKIEETRQQFVQTMTSLENELEYDMQLFNRIID
jgi:predicted  nucleic acid-binding Zn-ribbon protein